MPKWPRHWLDWLGAHELPTLFCFVLLAAGLWAFAEMADEVLEGETQRIDRLLLLSMRSPGDLSDPLGPAWVEELGRDITALGGIGILTFRSLWVVGFLILMTTPSAALVLFIVVLGGLAVSQLLKWQFGRARPELVPHETHVYSASFPSGHAMLSAATYLTLAAFLARVHAQRRMKAYFLIVAILVTVAIGISRVYLGVHWPTDVLAGWTLGACWAILCWLLAGYLQRRGEIEESHR